MDLPTNLDPEMTKLYMEIKEVQEVSSALVVNALLGKGWKVIGVAQQSNPQDIHFTYHVARFYGEVYQPPSPAAPVEIGEPIEW